MPYGFKFLLVRADGEPFDPAELVTAAPSWSVGDVATFGAGEQARVLVVEREIADELVDAGFIGVLTVEPLD